MGILHMLKNTNINDLNTAEEYLKKSINETINESSLSQKISPSKSTRSKSKSPTRNKKESESLNPRNMAKSIIDKFPFKN